ncbi:hypothetical protein BJ508DRAFT_329550 [Ascobolus immersus RN42]|uniref:Uncharacterized protein n=1 Tax=Ascobolus immersus RN42 TaxID=1160509 RepID=A0A3N4I1S1_ASCIM|nr:hypothetical protein BJ508DRAFT_329550 [Ascobolus immersus RN42]
MHSHSPSTSRPTDMILHQRRSALRTRTQAGPRRSVCFQHAVEISLVPLNMSAGATQADECTRGRRARRLAAEEEPAALLVERSRPTPRRSRNRNTAAEESGRVARQREIETELEDLQAELDEMEIEEEASTREELAPEEMQRVAWLRRELDRLDGVSTRTLASRYVPDDVAMEGVVEGCGGDGLQTLLGAMRNVEDLTRLTALYGEGPYF